MAKPETFLRDENKRLRGIIEDIRQALGMQIDDDDILAEIKYLQEKPK